jgi:hypothetical protein
MFSSDTKFRTWLSRIGMGQYAQKVYRPPQLPKVFPVILAAGDSSRSKLYIEDASALYEALARLANSTYVIEEAYRWPEALDIGILGSSYHGSLTSMACVAYLYNRSVQPGAYRTKSAANQMYVTPCGMDIVNVSRV